MLRPCGNFKRNYKEDEAIFQTTFIKLSMLAFFILLFLVPFVTDRYVVNFINIIGIFIVGAIGINIITGFTGIVSLGHGAFMGIGAYSTTLLITKFNLPLLIALPIGGFISASLGIIPGLACLRIKGLYLAIATLAAQVIFDFVIIENQNLTGGDLGLSVPVTGFFSRQSDHGQILYYFLIYSIVVVLTFFARNLFRTKPGRLFIAVRDNDLASGVLGISVGKVRLASFWLGTFYAGIAGGLWAAYSETICPEQFSFLLSIQFLSIILVGGMGSILGSIFGTIFILLIPEVLTSISIELRGLSNIDISSYLSIINNGVFGLLIIVFLVFEPNGLARIWWKIKQYLKLWPFSYME